jgi:chromosome partitioning protein
MGKTSVVTIANQKGGVGKTTTVLSLASAFSKIGKKVLVVDMDYQGNASSGLGLKAHAKETGRTLAEAIRKNLKIADIRLRTQDSNIDLIASEISLNKLIIELTGRPNQFHILSRILDCPETDDYDVVLVDTHPSLDCLFQSAMAASHYYLVPMFAEPDPFEGLQYMVEEVNEIRENLNPMLHFLGVIVTRFDKSNSTHVKFDQLLRSMSKKRKIRVFNSRVPISNAVAGASASERSVVSYNSQLPVSIAYVELAKELGPELIGKRMGRKAASPEVNISPRIFQEVFEENTTQF